MPNLADVKPVGLEAAWMGRLLTGAGIAQHPDDKLASRVIVLARVALAEYEEARRCLQPPRSSYPDDFPWLTTVYGPGTAHVETCLIVLSRIFTMAKQLKKRGTLPSEVESALPSQNMTRLVSRLRDAIEHADRDIMREADEPAEDDGEAIFLYAGPRGVEIRAYHLTWNRLADCIRDVAASASALAHHRPSGSDPT